MDRKIGKKLSEAKDFREAGDYEDFFVVSKEDVKVYSLKEKGMISQLADVIPEIMEKCKCGEEEGKKED